MISSTSPALAIRIKDSTLSGCASANEPAIPPPIECPKRTERADDELPDKVDLDSDGELPRKYDLDPEELREEHEGQSPAVG